MSFKDWLLAEINQRGWSIGDLARASGVSRSALSNVLRDERDAGPELCRGIARAFKLPPEQVFRYAGLLPQAQDMDQLSPELTHIFALLEPDGRDDLLAFARFKLQEQDAKPKYNGTVSDTPTTPRT